MQLVFTSNISTGYTSSLNQSAFVCRSALRALFWGRARQSSPLCALWSSKDIHTIACSRLYRVCFPTGFTDVTMSISPWEKIVSLCKINCHSAKTIRYALILKIFSYSEKNAVFCVLKGNYNVYPILLLQNKSGLCESWWCDQQLCSKSSSHV